MEKQKLTKLELSWILYDVGNSAFILLVSTLFPIYFDTLAEAGGLSEVQYLAYWGYAASAVTLIVALIGPVFGTIADTKGYKKPIFTVSMLVGVIGCAVLAVPRSWMAFLLVFIIAKIGYSSSLVFYDSMLSDVTTHDLMDGVSSHGYAWGYIGSCVPFVLSLVLVLGCGSFGLSASAAMAAAFILNAAWWLLCTVPLMRNFRQLHGVSRQAHPVRASFARLRHVIKDMKKDKKAFMFLLAFFFYIDGVYTIIDMATAYGEALGLDSTGLLLALLLTQVVAFPFALIFGRLAKKYENARLIRVCILAYTAIALFAIQMDKQWEFWLLAVCVGMFQGGIQALSRSYFAKIIPAQKAGEYFGIFDICGKGASFMGTALVGMFAQITGSPNAGVAVLAVMFLIGYVLFGRAQQIRESEA